MIPCKEPENDGNLKNAVNLFFSPKFELGEKKAGSTMASFQLSPLFAGQQGVGSQKTQRHKGTISTFPVVFLKDTFLSTTAGTPAAPPRKFRSQAQETRRNPWWVDVGREPKEGPPWKREDTETSNFLGSMLVFRGARFIWKMKMDASPNPHCFFLYIYIYILTQIFKMLNRHFWYQS